MMRPYEVADVGELRAIAFKIVVEPEDAPHTVLEVIKDLADTFRIGKVLSIGSEAKQKIPDLSIGDRVLYAQSLATTTAVAKRHVVHHDHVLCIVLPPLTVRDLDPRALSDGRGAQVRIGHASS